MFFGRGEFMPTPDVALAVRKVTARQCERISRVAFDWARNRRKKVTAVHKANVFHVSDGLFLREVRKVAKEYPDVELDEKIVDAMAALLVRDPSKFDCIVTGNMFGDILSDEASEISGSLGLAGSTMAGDDACCAQAQHGSAPDIQGQDKANPTSLILSAAMLLEWLAARHKRPELDQAAKAIEAAIDAALQKPETRTPDLQGKLGTRAFSKHIAAAIG
jgi:isocitrate/isopropylmalate dehydrogenase